MRYYSYHNKLYKLEDKTVYRYEHIICGVNITLDKDIWGCSHTEEVYRWVWNPVGSHKHLKGLDRHANKINKKKAEEIMNMMKMAEELKK